MALVFQSTPVIANGRIRAIGHRRCVVARFNPRPLLLTGESAVSRSDYLGTDGFQSTPVIANGRITG